MNIGRYGDVEEKKVSGAIGARIRWLISPRNGAKNFAMRHITLKGGGSTPRHEHDYEHEVFILEGKGMLFYDGSEYEISKGSFMLIEGNREHQFVNTENDHFEILCIIPIKENSIPEEENTI